MNSLKQIFESSIYESIEVKSAFKIDSNFTKIEKAATLVISAIKNGNKVMLCGNGGSAADSQHIAAEFVSRFLFDRPAMAAVALTTDTSALTAIGNDYGFNQIFARQVRGIGKAGDVLIGLSTSGNSKNIRLAADAAKDNGIETIGLGGLGGSIWSSFETTIQVPSTKTARIQECHILIGHIICEIVEAALWQK